LQFSDLGQETNVSIVSAKVRTCRCSGSMLQEGLIDDTYQKRDNYELRAKKVFNRYDVDGNKSLDVREFKMLLRKLCRKYQLPPPTRQDVIDAIKSLDSSGDGLLQFDGTHDDKLCFCLAKANLSPL